MTFSAQAAETELRSSTKPPYLTPKFRQKGAALTTKVQHKTSLPPMTTETPQDLKSLGFSPPSAGYPGIPELNHKTLSNSPRTPTNRMTFSSLTSSRNSTQELKNPTKLANSPKNVCQEGATPQVQHNTAFPQHTSPKSGPGEGRRLT